MEILVKKTNGDLIHTQINTTDPKEIAEHYFSMGDTESIEIIDGGIFENENFSKRLIKIWKENEDIIKKNELDFNVRMSYEICYKNPLPDGTTTITESCGLLNIN